MAVLEQMTDRVARAERPGITRTKQRASVWGKHCWVSSRVCGEVCKEAMLGVGEALQRSDKRVGVWGRAD